MTRLFTLPHAATTDDWYTPAWIFEAMGETFDLDVCTPPGGVPWIPAKAFYTPDDDGLSQPWTGFVWCNPPFSGVKPWCLKWCQHWDGIIVLRSDFSSSGISAVFRSASSMFVPQGRLNFVDGQGSTRERDSVNFSSVLFGAGDRADAALARLSDRGVVRALVERE